jgi:hypothetical protein
MCDGFHEISSGMGEELLRKLSSGICEEIVSQEITWNE